MSKAHILGFPRVGAQRELKWALESYWKGESSGSELLATGRQLRLSHWQAQQDAGLDFVTVGDFSFYDHVLDASTLLGVVPKRFGWSGGQVDLETYFRMARGRAVVGDSGETYACEMTKWFDTNYHYLVPEFDFDQGFEVSSSKLFDEVQEAREAGFPVKPVLLGPLSYLWLGKENRAGERPFDRLDLLNSLLPVYSQILIRLKALGVEWVQVDEPALVLDLPQAWKTAYESAYNRLQTGGLNILLTTYFDALHDNLNLAVRLPVAGLHVDTVRAPEQLNTVIDQLPPYKILSLGVVDGRNVWRNDFERSLRLLETARSRLGERVWVGSSCSLLHVPFNLDVETKLDPELKSWLAFAQQKLSEVRLLAKALNEGRQAVADELADNRRALEARQGSARIHKSEVKSRLDNVDAHFTRRRSEYTQRAVTQRQVLQLPLLPTTTIGSFPQTPEIRIARRDYKAGRINEQAYRERMQAEIRQAIAHQEAIGLDVLVHGEAERNDMVEYFGEHLEGFAFTQHGWVQSYGSRCVKPPVIYGDISRPAPIAVEWAQYAQSLTARPVKGMLTGPVTVLQWSFVRDDQPREMTCGQIALALRDEVADLEAAGIQVIQIDEPAFREGLPLRRSVWNAYLRWAVDCFKIASCAVGDGTQIHTHMCYAEFNDIIEAIAALDADVITIETSRSRMELLEAFRDFKYPNEIGPGVYDIHSPRTPAVSEMTTLLSKASRCIPVERLWINPDCGLKTRNWPEVQAALENMVTAAKNLRKSFLTASGATP